MTDGTNIRIGALEGFRDLVFELGSDPSRVLQSAKIDEALWLTPDATISTEQYRAALNTAARNTNSPHFGLLLSQRQSLLKFGALGYLLINAPNLRTALNFLVKHLQMHDTGTLSTVIIEDESALITHKLAGVGKTSTIQQTELGVGLVLKFIRTAIGPEWAPDAVYFEHSEPTSTLLFSRIFQCPVYFDNDQSGIEFPARVLGRPLIAADPKLYQILKNYMEQLVSESAANISNQVRGKIMQTLETGSPYIDHVAASLSYTRAELQRRLKKENTSYQKILEEVRFGIARKYLMDTDLPLSTITAILSYSEPAVFSRAFKRLSGITPRAWRDKNRPHRL